MLEALLNHNAEYSTFVELLQAMAAKQAGRRALTFLLDGESQEIHLSYGDLDSRTRALAGWLQTTTSPGDRVLLLHPFGPEYVAALFGCLYAGVVPVPTYPPRANRSLARLQAIVADAGATVALTTASVLGDLDSQLSRQPTLGPLHWMASETIPAASADDWRQPAIDGDTPALLQYTSGSTGTPKGVVVTHRNLLANQRSIRIAFGNSQATIGFGWLPLYHDMGLIGKVLQPLYLGGACVLMPPVAFLQKPIRWLRAISRYRVTTSGAPNFAYEHCMHGTTPEQREGLDLSSWRVAFNGAEPVRAETIERFTEIFAPYGFRASAFQPCYGLAEATLIVSGGAHDRPPVLKTVRASALQRHRVEAPLPGDNDSRTLVGCGKALPDHRIVIVHPETLRRCIAGEVGEIWFAGPSATRGYWGQSDRAAETFRARLADSDEGPFLRTGDLGFLDDGELFVTGRRKDLIIIRGRNHYPQDIERTVERSHPALYGCLGAAFSIEADGQERLAVVQEVRREYLRRLDADEVTAAIRQAIVEEYEIPVERISLVKTASIRKTSSGKIQRNACRQDFLAGSLAEVARWSVNTTQAFPPDMNGKPEADKQHAGNGNVGREGLACAAPPTAAAIQTWLLDRIAQRLGVAIKEINPRQPFAKYGLDSVAAVQMAEALEQWLGRPVEPTAAYDYPTAELLSHRLAGDLQESAWAVDSPSGHEPIAVIGLGCRFPGADSPEAFWQLLHEGRDAIADLPADRLDGGTKGGYLAAIDRFDPQFFGIAPREAETMDPQQRLLLEVSYEALENAGIAADRAAGTNAGVFIGISNSDYARRLLGSSRAVELYAGTGNALSIAANRISYVFDFHGPSWAVDTACSSSLVALHQACRSLREGECDLALAGGVNVILAPEVTAAFGSAGMLAADGRCKSFDATADGYVRGEGCGIVVLKRLSRALRDGDTISALIRGTAVNQDGRSNGLTAPNGPSQKAVIRRALSDAGMTASDLSYVEAHGTGTSLGDPIELNSLADLLVEGRSASEPCWIGSVKTNIGHLEAAAGIAGLIKVVLALEHGEIPPHLHFKQLNPAIRMNGDCLSIPTAVQAWPAGSKARVAGLSSFGFGGTNAHAIVEEAPPRPRRPPGEDRPLHLWTVSARTPRALAELAARYRDFLDTHPRVALADACFSANASRSHLPYRAAVVAASAAEAQERLALLAAGAGQALQPDVSEAKIGRERNVRLESLTYAGHAIAAPKVAFVVGSGRCLGTGVGRQLVSTHPQFREILARCDAVLRPLVGQSLMAVLFPDPGTSPETNQSACRPAALLAVEYALAQLWKSWGVKPSSIVARREGCHVAAVLAGVIRLEDGLKLAALEGRLAEAESRRSTNGEPTAGQIRGEMQELCESIHRAPPTIPIVASDSVERAERNQDPIDAEILLELGPQSSPIDVVGGKDRLWLAGLAEDRADWEQMLQTLAQLYTAGVAIDFAAFDAPYCRSKVVLPNYPFQRQRYWIETPIARPAEEVQGVSGDDVSSESLEQTTSGAAENLFYNIQWRPAPLRDPESSLFEMPTPAATVRGLVGRGAAGSLSARAALADKPPVAPESPSSADLKRYIQLLGRLEDVSIDFVLRALGELGLEFAPKRSFSTDSVAKRLGVPDRNRRLLTRLLEMLAEENILHGGDDCWQVVQSSRSVDPRRQVQQLAAEHPEATAELTLLDRCGSELARVLRGQCDPLELLAPDGDLSLLERLYQDSPGAKAMNRLLRDAVQSALQEFPASRPLRVLELGAGTGGATSILLPALPADRTEYIFTDLSPLFMARAKKKFAAWQFVRYEVLDIEKSPDAQTFASRRFDLVVAANVLHATRDLRQTLSNVCELLNPGGLLVLLETTSRQRWLDLIFGLTDGWWRFDDAPLRTSHPLLTSSQWQTLLVETGFAEPTALTVDRGVEEEEPPQVIFLAQRPPAVNRENAALRGSMPESKHAVACRMKSGDESPHSKASLARDDRLEGNWLILADRQGTGQQLAETIHQRGGRCTLATVADEFSQTGNGAMRLRPHCPDDFRAAINTAVGSGDALRGIVHLWSLDAAEADALDTRALEAAWRLGCGSVQTLVRAVDEASPSPPPAIWLVTRGVQAVVDGDRLSGLAQSAMCGLARVIGLEHPRLACVHVDLDPQRPEGQWRSLVQEIAKNDGREDRLAWRGGRRYAARLAGRELPLSMPTVLHSDATYWIVGGLGALGLRTAAWMVERGARHLVLTGRSGLPPRVEWESLPQESKPGKQVRVIQSLESRGAAVTIRPADIGDPAQVADVTREIAAHHPPLRGIIHAAAVAGYRTVAEMDAESFAAVLRPKALGAWHLLEQVRGLLLDFFICYSSTSSLWGAKGQGHYSAANAFLDALAHYGRSRGLPMLAVNWGLWSSGGLADETFHDWAAQSGTPCDGRDRPLDAFGGQSADDYRNWLAQSGIGAIEPDEAFAALDRLLASGTAQMAVTRVDWRRFTRTWEAARPRPFLDEVRALVVDEPDVPPPPTVPPDDLRRRLEMTTTAQRRAILAGYLNDQIADVLGLRPDEVIAQQPLSHMGLDSLMAIELKSRIKTASGVDLPMVHFIESLTISDLAGLLEERILATSDSEWIEGAL